MANEPEAYDPEKARNQVSDALTRGSVLVVDDPEKCIQAREWRRMAWLLYKEAEKHYDKIKKPINAAVKGIRTQEKQDLEPMDQLMELLDPKIVQFEENEKRQQELLQRQLTEQATKLAQETRDARIQELENAGEHQRAEELRKQPIFIPPVVIPERRDWLPGEGRDLKYSVDEEKIDILALAAAVANGQLPQTAIEPHLPTLNKLAEAIKDTGEIPGCKIVRRVVITQRQ